MRKLKRVIGILLVVVCVINLVPIEVFAEPDTNESAIDSGDVNIEGTNSFGNLLSEELTEYQLDNEENYQEGYTITDLVIEDSSATINYDSMEEALLVVALYTEDGLQMLQSSETLIQPEESTAVVNFEGEMPEYFLASAYMVDTYDFSPLCTAYETPMYTKEMQELLASTIEDYDAERVLNLDEDTSTNFAVYADSTVIIEDADGANEIVGVDDENEVYTIENADESILNISEGEVFAYPYEEGKILIVKVKEISVNGTTATITGDDLEMEEVFSYMKLEIEGQTSDLIVDENTGDEGITYLELQEETPETYSMKSTRAFEEEIEREFALQFEIDREKESKDGKRKVTISGNVSMKFDTELSYYISLKRQYIKFKTDAQLGVCVGVDGTLSNDLCKFPSVGFSPIVGVFIGFEPRLELEFSGKAEWDCVAGITLGVAYDSKFGAKNLCTKPKIESKLNFEGKIFFGIDLNPHVSILSDAVGKVSLEGPVGLELTGAMKGSNFEVFSVGFKDEIHSCKACLEGDIFAKLELSFELEFLKCDKLSVSADLYKFNKEICEFYYSFDRSDFSFGNCPHYKYHLTIKVEDEEGKLLKDISVETSEGEICGRTNEKGVTTCYLPTGTYKLHANIKDNLKYEKELKLEEACKVTISKKSSKTIVLRDVFGDIDTEVIKDYYGTVLASGECGNQGENVKWILYQNGLLYIYGNGVMSEEPAHGDITDENFDETKSWLKYAMLIKKVIIKHGVTNIGDQRFLGCQNLADIEIPSSVKTIDENVFCDCIRLKKIEIPSGVKSIETLAFQKCESLECIEIPGSVTKMGEWVFFLCRNLKSITFKGKAPSFEGLTFKNNSITVYYPANDPSWTADVMNDYGGHVTWVPYEANAGNSVSEFSLENSEENKLAVQVESKQDEVLGTNAVYSGEYKSEKTDTCTLKIAAFSGLVPNEQYVLLAVADLDAEDPLNADNLLCIKQGESDSQGNLCFQYVQRELKDISYVVVCGPSNKNLKDAKIIFSSMIAGEEVQAVEPVVIYDGKTLKENDDYVLVGTVNYTETGEYTCYVRGVRNYTGLVKCTYCVNNPVKNEVVRISGQTRYETSFEIADTYKEQIGLENFDAVLVASGKNFADALAGSYLSSVKKAPILITNGKNIADLENYIENNLKKGGTIYLLGGEAAVSNEVEQNLADNGNIKRLAGQTRYETNLEILKEAGVGSQELLVCTGRGFADSLSASAAEKPILLVGKSITDAQLEFLESYTGDYFYIIGGEGSISTAIEWKLKQYGETQRIGGATRYETSILVAKEFFEKPKAAVLASAKNFPDGLCGGPLAANMGAPLILTATNKESEAISYVEDNKINIGAVLGGDSLISDESVRKVFYLKSEGRSN